MGSQLQNQNLAYIAGFLDGDGSLMLQIKRRSDMRSGWRLMATICFYQDSRYRKSFRWIRNQLGIGYISQRNDGISELRINGYQQVREILKKLLPYLRFKKERAKKIVEILGLLERKKLRDWVERDYQKLIENILFIQNQNYQSPRKKKRQQLLKILGLTP